MPHPQPPQALSHSTILAVPNYLLFPTVILAVPCLQSSAPKPSRAAPASYTLAPSAAKAGNCCLRHLLKCSSSPLLVLLRKKLPRGPPGKFPKCLLRISLHSTHSEKLSETTLGKAEYPGALRAPQPQLPPHPIPTVCPQIMKLRAAPASASFLHLQGQAHS